MKDSNETKQFSVIMHKDTFAHLKILSMHKGQQSMGACVRGLIEERYSEIPESERKMLEKISHGWKAKQD